jgi:glucokinase
MKPLCIDLGATNIRAAFVNKTAVLNKNKVKNPDKQAETLKELYGLIDQYKGFSSINISIAGYEQKGKIYGARNMDFNGVPLAALLKKRYHKPVYIENDADCACLAEKYYGFGKGKKNFILLTLGTGIGGACVINGKVFEGPNNGAMQIGGSIIENNVWEKVASGNGSVNIAHAAGLNVSSLELEEMANQGDKKALEIYNEVGRLLGLGLVNISYVIDPEIIILGGGFAKVKHIYPNLLATFKKHDDIHRIKPLQIVHAKLSDDAGLIGASLIPVERKLKS